MLFCFSKCVYKAEKKNSFFLLIGKLEDEEDE